MTKRNQLGIYIDSCKDLNYTKLAKHLGMSRQNFWLKAHEPIKVNNISLGTFNRIARVQNISVGELVNRIMNITEE